MKVYLDISELHIVQVHALKSLNICVHLQNHLHDQEGACPYSLKVFCLFVFFLFGWQRGERKEQRNRTSAIGLLLAAGLGWAEVGSWR